MGVEELAKTMLDLFLAEMVLCTDRFEEPDVEFWSDTYCEVAPRARELCREILAYQATKRRFRESRAGNPRNVVAVLLYNVSHSVDHDQERREVWEKRIEEGYSLDQVCRVDEALDVLRDLRGSSLTEQLIGDLMGRVVNLGRISGVIQEEYTRICGGEPDATE